MYMSVREREREIGSPIELPSLNKDFTYLLTYLPTLVNLLKNYNVNVDG